MPEVVTPMLHGQRPGEPPIRGLAARALGVIVSPGKTYADIAAQPRPLPALGLVLVVTSLSLGLFLSTDVGRNAALDQSLSMVDSFSVRLSDAQMRHVTQLLEARAEYAPLYAVAGILVGLPVTFATVAGLGMLVLNTGLGGEATFEQMFAIVAYSGIIPLLQTVLVTPLDYARKSLSDATSLLAVLPMADDAGFLGRLLGWIDLFRIWWILSLAVGLGVLYRRRSGPIAAVILACYALFALVAAGLMTAFLGT